MVIHRSQTFSVINLDSYCIDQDIKVCAIQLDVLFRKLCTLTIYRSPSCKFKSFIALLGLILQLFIFQKFILSCGNFNSDFSKDLELDNWIPYSKLIILLLPLFFQQESAKIPVLLLVIIFLIFLNMITTEYRICTMDYWTTKLKFLQYTTHQVILITIYNFIPDLSNPVTLCVPDSPIRGWSAMLRLWQDLLWVTRMMMRLSSSFQTAALLLYSSLCNTLTSPKCLSLVQSHNLYRNSCEKNDHWIEGEYRHAPGWCLYIALLSLWHYYRDSRCLHNHSWYTMSDNIPNIEGCALCLWVWLVDSCLRV